jgi:S-adenosylmethionine:tRNA ribosyltransferase-isomerase
MRLEELDYQLPDELIARKPAEPRDHSRLLHLSRTSGDLLHTRFDELPRFLRKGDCLVLNDTRVIPACFFCNRETGGKVEGLFLRADAQEWRVLLKPGGKLRVGETLISGGRAPGKYRFTLLERLERGAWRIRLSEPADALSVLEEIGQPPLPPYIRAGRRAAGGAEVSEEDSPHYQTAFARSPGAVAAPTAGLHFTPELLERLRSGGIETRFVTLHVGLGTFEPLEAEQIEAQRLHAEWYEIRGETIAALQATRAAGGRIVAVGTTSCRVLESFAPTPRFHRLIVGATLRFHRLRVGASRKRLGVYVRIARATQRRTGCGRSGRWIRRAGQTCLSIRRTSSRSSTR